MTKAKHTRDQYTKSRPSAAAAMAHLRTPRDGRSRGPASPSCSGHPRALVQTLRATSNALRGVPTSPAAARALGATAKIMALALDDAACSGATRSSTCGHASCQRQKSRARAPPRPSQPSGTWAREQWPWPWTPSRAARRAPRLAAFRAPNAKKARALRLDLHRSRQHLAGGFSALLANDPLASLPRARAGAGPCSTATITPASVGPRRS